MIPKKWADCLKENFGFDDFRPGQLAIIRSVMSGRDTLAVMPTGGGKSLCFQLPALLHNQLVVVVSPLIALMKDQVSHLRQIGVPAGCLFSHQDQQEREQIFAEIKRKFQAYLLYVSPERVQNPGFSTWLAQQEVALFAVDEAHCISQWGSDFRQDYCRLSVLREIHPQVPIVALTATATVQALQDITQVLRLNKPQQHIYGFYRPNLFYQVAHCQSDIEKVLYLREALGKTPSGRILIYCGTRQQAESLAGLLGASFAQVGCYHAGLSSEVRQRVQGKFSLGEIRILAATNAFGMGVDYPDVRLVVHYQMPATIEGLYQEMGRAGRDGLNSTCLVLYQPRDQGLQKFFIKNSRASAEVLTERWRLLSALIYFLERHDCRHAQILAYFQDRQRLARCGHCDVCAPQSARSVSVQGQSVLTMARSQSLSFWQENQPSTNQEPQDRRLKRRMQQLRRWWQSWSRENKNHLDFELSELALQELAQKNPTDWLELSQMKSLPSEQRDRLGPSLLSELRRVSKSRASNKFESP